MVCYSLRLELFTTSRILVMIITGKLTNRRTQSFCLNLRMFFTIFSNKCIALTSSILLLLSSLWYKSVSDLCSIITVLSVNTNTIPGRWLRTPYTVVNDRIRPPYFAVFHRKRSFTTVHVRPGILLHMMPKILNLVHQLNNSHSDPSEHCRFLFVVMSFFHEFFLRIIFY